jgi:hypothetical protein
MTNKSVSDIQVSHLIVMLISSKGRKADIVHALPPQWLDGWRPSIASCVFAIVGQLSAKKKAIGVRIGLSTKGSPACRRAMRTTSTARGQHRQLAREGKKGNYSCVSSALGADVLW